MVRLLKQNCTCESDGKISKRQNYTYESDGKITKAKQFL